MSGAPKLIFSSVVSSLLEVAEGRVAPETQKRLTEWRFTKSQLQPAYPAEQWAEVVRFVSADLFPSMSEEQQHRKLGDATVLRFAETIMGKAMFTVAKVLGATRSLSRMTKNLKTGANFIETRFTVIDATQQELWINDVSGVPGFYAGLLGAGAQFIEGWANDIVIKAREGDACTYELRVTPR